MTSGYVLHELKVVRGVNDLFLDLIENTRRAAVSRDLEMRLKRVAFFLAPFCLSIQTIASLPQLKYLQVICSFELI